MRNADARPFVAIACGGTGGHLFPGLAIADELQAQCDVTLLISHKEVDQTIAATRPDLDFVSLPAVGLQRGARLAFLGGFIKSYRLSLRLFRQRRPAAVLAMGGFTSAPPVVAARRLGCPAYLHEANSVAGRANRWLARWVQEAFVFFPSAKASLRKVPVRVVGMPVRSEFCAQDAEACRMTLGLDPNRPVLLVMGGSQGAAAINQLMLDSLDLLHTRIPELQYIHLTGPRREQSIREAYTALRCRAVVRPFLTEMELAMNAATAAVSRAGASSLAELAAVRLPAVLLPYPAAADNHQYFNAQALVETQAAFKLAQSGAQPGLLVQYLEVLVRDEPLRAQMCQALSLWHHPQAAQDIARRLLGAQYVPNPAPESPLMPKLGPDSPAHPTMRLKSAMGAARA